jgi:hypothetical protein
MIIYITTKQNEKQAAPMVPEWFYMFICALAGCMVVICFGAAILAK